jgi:serine/threonine protein phosphatase PrpC
MTSELLQYDFGAYRRSEDGKAQEGHDGALVLPEKKILAVADGIGHYDGDGALVVELVRKFAKAGMPLQTLFLAIAEMAQELKGPFLSTFVGLQLPETSRQKGLCIATGDSSAFRIRDNNGSSSITRLVIPQNMAFLLRAEYPELKNVEEQARCGKLSKKEARRWIKRIENFLRKDLKEHERLNRQLEDILFYASQDCSSPALRGHLHNLIYICEKSMNFSLGDSVEVLAKTAERKRFGVRKGDRIVLCTDGVVENSTESVRALMELVLKASTAKKAARTIVDSSGIHDDRAAVVAIALEN